MSLPQFTATQKLSDRTDTTVQSIVRVVNGLVDNLQQIFTSLLSRVNLDRVLLKGIVITSGTNTIPHTLGRTLTGWEVANIDQLVVLFAPQPQPNPGTYLTLVASGPCTITLEVF